MIAPAFTPPPPVAATLAPAAAAASRWNCAIVGAGPAGAAAALRLARRGLSVVLLDAAPMPRPKVCGSCLSPTAMRELRALRAGPAVTAGIVPLDAVRLVTAGGAAAVRMAGGAVLSRETLDAELVRAAIVAGAAWLPETRIAAVGAADGGALLRGRAGGSDFTVRADMAVIASGLGGTVRLDDAPSRARPRPRGRRLGIGVVLADSGVGPPPGELLMAVGRRGYCGLVRLEDGRLDLAAAIDRDAVATAATPAAAIATILAESLGAEEARRIERELAGTIVRGTPPLTHATGPVAGASGRILRIGDAAGYVEPFTGEGMGWALAGARLLDEALAGGPLETAGRRYADAYRGRFAVHHARCRAVAHAVRRPLVMGCVAVAARMLPAVAARVLPLVVGSRTAAEARA